jgi:hypothetical protein
LRGISSHHTSISSIAPLLKALVHALTCGNGIIIRN